jgi:hypothetical protein
VRATHNYTNSAYTSTDLVMEFGEDKQSFTIRPLAAYTHLCAMLNIFGRRIDTAKSQDDVRYFYEQDDFREIDPDKPPEKPEGLFLRNSTICAVTVIVYVLAYAVADGINRQKPEWSSHLASASYKAPTRAYVPPAPAYTPPPAPVYTPPPAPVVLQPSYPEYALPDNGMTVVSTGERQIARFKVSAPEGAHYWVKLVDATTSTPVVAMFVRAGSTAEVKVPAGSYVIKYASGNKWYGTTHLFGPDTAYGKANEPMRFWVEGNIIHGHSMTLYKVRNGNLRTETIPASEF